MPNEYKVYAIYTIKVLANSAEEAGESVEPHAEAALKFFESVPNLSNDVELEDIRAFREDTP